MNNLIKFSLLLGLALLVTACTNLEEDNADPGVEALNFGTGSSSCFELVYPLSILLPDSTEVVVDSLADIKTAKQEFAEANPDERVKISFVYPLTATDELGEMISIASQEELKALKQECKGERVKDSRTSCFTVVYPITYVTPEGDELTAADKAELKALISDYKEANPDAELPTLQFPIQIINGDDETVEVADQEALDLLKEACSEAKGNKKGNKRGK